MERQDHEEGALLAAPLLADLLVHPTGGGAVCRVERT
jgi:hypothetical protein